MKKIISIILVLLLFSSVLMLSACDIGSVVNGDSDVAIPEKANYVTIKIPDKSSAYHYGYIIDAIKLNDNYYLLHYVYGSEQVTITHKNNITFSYRKDTKNNSSQPKSLDKDEMLGLFDGKIYTVGDWIAYEYKDGDEITYEQSIDIFWNVDVPKNSDNNNSNNGGAQGPIVPYE